MKIDNICVFLEVVGTSFEVSFVCPAKLDCFNGFVSLVYFTRMEGLPTAFAELVI